MKDLSFLVTRIFSHSRFSVKDISDYQGKVLAAGKRDWPHFISINLRGIAFCQLPTPCERILFLLVLISFSVKTNVLFLSTFNPLAKAQTVNTQGPISIDF